MACESPSRTARGVLFARPPTSRSWWWSWKARLRKRACATCSRRSTRCCAPTPKSARTIRRFEPLPSDIRGSGQAGWNTGGHALHLFVSCPGMSFSQNRSPPSRQARSSPRAGFIAGHALSDGFLERGPERMRRIDAENLHFLGVEGELLEGKDDVAVLRVALDIGIELGREKVALDHVAFELRHIDAVGREAAERLVQRRRNVANPEQKGGDDRA